MLLQLFYSILSASKYLYHYIFKNDKGFLIILFKIQKGINK